MVEWRHEDIYDIADSLSRIGRHLARHRSHSPSLAPRLYRSVSALVAYGAPSRVVSNRTGREHDGRCPPLRALVTAEKACWPGTREGLKQPE